MARIFFVTIFALLFGILLARQPTLQDLQAAKQATYDKLTTLWGVKPSDLKVVAQEGRRLQSVSGFMFATTYAGEKCHGQKRADLVVGYATDVCLASKKVSGYSARSFIFTCTDGKFCLLINAMLTSLQIDIFIQYWICLLPLTDHSSLLLLYCCDCIKFLIFFYRSMEHGYLQ